MKAYYLDAIHDPGHGTHASSQGPGVLLRTMALLWAVFVAWGWSGLAAAASPLAVRAVAGTPLGAGSVSVVLSDPLELSAAATGSLHVTEASGRILYPVVARDDCLRLLQSLAGGATSWGPERFEVFFLFTGDAPLEVTVDVGSARSRTVEPLQAPRLHRATLARWWREYRRTLKRQSDAGDYYPIAEAYLTHMLGNRLGMRIPPAPVDRRRADPGREMFELLTGAEAQERDVLARILTDTIDTQPPTFQLPAAEPWQRPTTPSFPDADLELLARQVPGDCFYVRFGKFSNFLWLDKLTQEAGGDLARLVTLRAVQSDASQRIQHQLAIEELPFADLLGDKVIADVAFIGRDLLLDHGAAVGVIFQEAAPVIGPGLQQLRKSVQQRESDGGCQLTTTRVGNQNVSLLATPDNRLRSFYVSRDGFHLVTNCQAIVAAFLLLPETRDSLAEDPEFQRARSTLPLSRQDTVFAFVPRRFFEQLASPRYQVELSRRQRAAAEIRLFELARHAYMNELRAGLLPADTLAPPNNAQGLDQVSVESLVEHGVLPASFAERPDGSHLTMDGGRVVDSQRGALGCFLPVPDVAVAAVTAEELAKCQVVGDLRSAGWDGWDPLMFAIRRQADPEQPHRERLEFTVRVAPFDRDKYDRWLSIIGRPTTVATQPDPRDILTVEGVVCGGRLLAGVPDHHLLFCLRDTGQLPDIPIGTLLGKLQAARLAPAYLATWPELGLLRLLPLQGLAQDLGDGYAALPLGVYRRQTAHYAAVSFQPELLESLPAEFSADDTGQPAQLRVTLGDISQSSIAPWVNALMADRGLRASIGNVRFLNSLQSQFGAEPEECRELAESLTLGKLVCPLGGQFTHAPLEKGTAVWQSSRWAGTWPVRVAQPEEYVAPVVQWLRELRVRLALHADHAELQGSIVIQRQAPADAGQSAPLFRLFGAGP